MFIIENTYTGYKNYDALCSQQKTDQPVQSLQVPLLSICYEQYRITERTREMVQILIRQGVY